MTTDEKTTEDLDESLEDESLEELETEEMYSWIWVYILLFLVAMYALNSFGI